MKVLEHGGRIGRTLLFLPCTAEPVWAFAETIALLSEQWHVFQVVFDGHEPEEPGDFTSVEQTVDEVTEYLKAHGIARLDAAYGCSLGGACLTRFLALGEIPVGRAIIDGGITPYQLPYLLRKLILARDVLSFKLAANDRKVLEAAFPPERFTIPGHDPVKEYDAMEAYGLQAEGLLFQTGIRPEPGCRGTLRGKYPWLHPPVPVFDSQYQHH